MHNIFLITTDDQSGRPLGEEPNEAEADNTPKIGAPPAAPEGNSPLDRPDDSTLIAKAIDPILEKDMILGVSWMGRIPRWNQQGNKKKGVIGSTCPT